MAEPSDTEREYLMQTAAQLEEELAARVQHVRDPGALIAIIERTGEVIDFMIRTRTATAELYRNDPTIAAWIARAPIPGMLAVIVRDTVSAAMATGHVIIRPSKGGDA